MSAAQLARPCVFLSVLLLHTDLFINETAVAHKLGQLQDGDIAPSITPLRRQYEERLHKCAAVKDTEKNGDFQSIQMAPLGERGIRAERPGLISPLLTGTGPLLNKIHLLVRQGNARSLGVILQTSAVFHQIMRNRTIKNGNM